MRRIPRYTKRSLDRWPHTSFSQQDITGATNSLEQSGIELPDFQPTTQLRTTTNNSNITHTSQTNNNNTIVFTNQTYPNLLNNNNSIILNNNNLLTAANNIILVEKKITRKAATPPDRRRKRVQKVEDSETARNPKRRKNDTTNNTDKKQATVAVSDSTVRNASKNDFSPVSSIQSDSCSNSNHTSESSLSSATTKQVQTDIMALNVSTVLTPGDIEAKNSQIQTLSRDKDELRRQLRDIQRDLEKQSNVLQKCLAVNKKLLIEKSTLERKQARQKCMENRLRLGQFVTQRQGATFVENWVDGSAFTDLVKQQELIQRAREELERERRSLQKRRPNCEVKEKPAKTYMRAKSKDRSESDQNSNDGTKLNDKSRSLVTDWYEQDEILRLRQASLKKEETDLQIEYEKLERERNLHIRELKRIYNEDHS
ncbi:unnamed protein product, partial [Didymodactylos carnosus]